ncbi:DsbC family protein [Brachymonas sp. G13]|uniref:DsbC family protein n=1 Tax=Brachymonas wangyanguii TaxID=3130163 RepID=UPI00307EA43C
MNFHRLAACALLPASLLTLTACQQDAAKPATLASAAAPAAAIPASASADAMAALQQTLEQRIPQLSGHILEVSPSPMPGLYEVLASGNNLFYTDAQGDFLLNGSMLETRTQNDLTAERIDQLNAIAFDQLPTQDAFVTKRGDGSRQLAVFSDPNCPFCHRLEESLAKIDNITIHTYLLPILGDNSVQRAGQVWCATDRVKTWEDWMLRKAEPAAAAASCDTGALERNVAFAQHHGITGTPALIFANGKRVSGAIPTEEIEKLLAESQ